MSLFSPTTIILNLPLIIAAVLPALLLIIRVYRADKLEKESGKMIWRLILAGVISAFIAITLEFIGDLILKWLVPAESGLYKVIEYFIVVALSEEIAKYLMLKAWSWNSPEFNCRFDGVVYAVVVSLGFAIFENIGYVISNGFGTAVLRALTAIPGHASFGVFMGCFYGLAKGSSLSGDARRAKRFRLLAIIVPVLLHGTYDYIISVDSDIGTFLFIPFIIVLFIVANIFVSKQSKSDRYFTMPNGESVNPAQQVKSEQENQQYEDYTDQWKNY